MLGAAPSTPGFFDWSLDPPLVLVIGLAILYRIGSRRTRTPPRTRSEQRWRNLCFYAALAVVAVALASPLDALSEQLFWAHMVQHVLILMVAPPLIVLARPWLRLWRSLPIGARRALARSLVVSERTAPLRWISRTLGRPQPSFVLFGAVLLAWHLPGLFDATLRSSTLHALEHTLFFATAVMFWKQVIDSPPLRAPLGSVQRVAYVIGAMVLSWALAVVLAVAPGPLYDAYAQRATRPGGISAMADQQIAAGIMWVPGSLTFVIVLFAYVHRWLLPPPAATRTSMLAREH